MRRSAVSFFGKFAGLGIGAAFLSTSILSTLAAGISSCKVPPGGPAETKSVSREVTGTDTSDSWSIGPSVGPEQLSRTVTDPQSPQPLILYIGPNILFRSGHIPGAKRIGPASQSEGVEDLRKQLQDLPRTSEIVIYCGCCPWEHCPNVRPAFSVLQKMGFSNVKVLHLPNNFKQDWTDKGFAVQRGE